VLQGRSFVHLRSLYPHWYNLEALSLTYIYSDEQARAVHVASQGIVEALRKLYQPAALLRELGVTPP
jgi:hypothetical protein